MGLEMEIDICEFFVMRSMKLVVFVVIVFVFIFFGKLYFIDGWYIDMIWC